MESSEKSGVEEISDEDLLLRLSLLMIDELLLRLRIAFKRSAHPPTCRTACGSTLQLVKDVACKLNWFSCSFRRGAGSSGAGCTCTGATTKSVAQVGTMCACVRVCEVCGASVNKN